MIWKLLLGLAVSIVAGLAIGAVLRRWDDEMPGHDAAFARAQTDDHACELCHRVVAVRELVALHDDTALLCVPCATLMKHRRETRQEQA